MPTKPPAMQRPATKPEKGVTIDLSADEALLAFEALAQINQAAHLGDTALQYALDTLESRLEKQLVLSGPGYNERVAKAKAAIKKKGS